MSEDYYILKRISLAPKSAIKERRIKRSKYVEEFEDDCFIECTEELEDEVIYRPKKFKGVEKELYSVIEVIWTGSRNRVCAAMLPCHKLDEDTLVVDVEDYEASFWNGEEEDEDD